MEHDENTLQAFQASCDAGYYGFETDIRMTRDGELVVTHDSSLDRTTNGSGTVESHTKAEIEQMRTKQGNKILFLDELLDFLQDKPGLYVEFEMKTNPAELYPEERIAAYLADPRVEQAEELPLHKTTRGREIALTHNSLPQLLIKNPHTIVDRKGSLLCNIGRHGYTRTKAC